MFREYDEFTTPPDREHMDDFPVLRQQAAENDYLIPAVETDFPFERIEASDFIRRLGRYNLEAVFDKIDVNEHMQQREAAFARLTEEDRRTILRSIIQFAHENEGEVLMAMRLTGRETDRALSDELEERYGINADKVRIATEVFRITYAMWETNNIVKGITKGDDPTSVELQRIEDRLKAMEESAEFLEQFQIPATHVTHEDAGTVISQSDVLRKSVAGDESHYEGEGVYAGILGSYKGWNRGDTFYFNVPLADTLPIIVSYNYPKAMVNTLGEGLDIQKRDEIIATASGLQQWRQVDYENDPLSNWKIQVLSKYLGVPKGDVEVILDPYRTPTVIVDTEKEPIHWALLCRALRIPRFIPKKELSKSDIEYRES